MSEIGQKLATTINLLWSSGSDITEMNFFDGRMKRVTNEEMGLK